VPRPRALLAAALLWLHHLALAFWLGGIFALGMVAAPAVFGTAKAAGQVDNTQPLYRFAGEALGEVFRRFNLAVLIAGAVLVLAGAAHARLAAVCRIRAGVRTLLGVAATALAAYAAFGLTPPMLAARAAADWGAFDALHDQYTLAFKAQTILLLGSLALTTLMHVPEAPRAAAETASPAELG
jgi:hypothetical protein